MNQRGPEGNQNPTESSLVGVVLVFGGVVAIITGVGTGVVEMAEHNDASVALIVGLVGVGMVYLGNKMASMRH